MSAWGSETFENDSASDWLGDLKESKDFSLIRAAFIQVVEHGGTKRRRASILLRLIGHSRYVSDSLTADASSKALAAAEILAVWLGHPTGNLPNGLTDWVRQHAPPMQTDLIPLANKAISIIKTNSELKDLWEEGDVSEWNNAVADVERRINLPLKSG